MAGTERDEAQEHAFSLATLKERFPVFKDFRPLAIGIHKAIRAMLPEVDAGQLKLAIKRHVGSTRYLKSISQGGSRFDLDGNPAGEVTEEQRQQAADELRGRFKHAAERKRAEAQSKEQQEKLLKLAEKFGRDK